MALAVTTSEAAAYNALARSVRANIPEIMRAKVGQDEDEEEEEEEEAKGPCPASPLAASMPVSVALRESQDAVEGSVLGDEGVD